MPQEAVTGSEHNKIVNNGPLFRCTRHSVEIHAQSVLSVRIGRGVLRK